MRNRNFEEWKRGSGELLGFAIVVPFVMLLICAILSATQVSSLQQRLTYATYTASRAACVSNNEERAVFRADAVVADMYGSSYTGYKLFRQGETVTVPHLENGQVFLAVQMLAPEWKKGATLRCTLYQYIVPLIPFSNATHYQSLTVVIENDTITQYDDAD